MKVISLALKPTAALDVQVRELTGDMNLTKSEIESTQVSDQIFPLLNFSSITRFGPAFPVSSCMDCSISMISL